MKNLNKEVHELHKKGFSFNQIAQELGISKSKAYRIMNETVDVSEAETVVERPVSKTFQNVPKQPETRENGKEYNAESLKLQVMLRKIELKHEAKIKQLEFDEQDKKREFELKNNAINSENERLKNRIENFKQRTSNSELVKKEEEDDEIEEYIPELDLILKDEFCDFIEELLEQRRYYQEDFDKLFSTVKQLNVNIIDWAEAEDEEVDEFSEYELIQKIENVINHYYENFDNYRSFFGSTIIMEFEDEVYSEMQDYISQNSDK